MSKPLWMQLANMTEEQAAAEMAEDRRRMQSGEMSKAEAAERRAAWGQAAQYCKTQAELLEKVERLADATGCPHGTPAVRWLVDRGLLTEDGTFTEQAKGLRIV